MSKFFARMPNSFPVEHFSALWMPVNIVSEEKWWLVYLCDEAGYVRRSLLLGQWGRTALPVTLVLVGVAMAAAAASSARRLEEQVQHLRQQEQLEQQVQAVSEREQRRIGEELHEDLCQRLTGLEAAGRALEKRLKAKGPTERDLATEIVSELHESLGRAQQLADELQPVSLLNEGFLAAMDKSAERVRQRYRIECRVKSHNFPHLEDTGLATHLYRIAQEALNNAIRHSGATEIQIILTAEPDEIGVSVKDNGKGMPEESAQSPGMGLRIMRYRCGRINGSLTIEPSPGGGTTITCRCPRPAAVD